MGVQEWVNQARVGLEELEVEDLRRELAEGDPLVIDIRDVRERWKRGSIIGAKSVPRGMLEFWADPDSRYYKPFLRPERRTIVYCAGGMRSALAADALKRLGYTNVAHLRVGYDGWREQGGEWEPVPVPDNLGPEAE